jgi:hypothetical protein
MSIRTLIEINHDFGPTEAGLAEWASAMRRYIGSGDKSLLPQGVTFINQRRHSQPSPDGNIIRLDGLELRLDIDRAKWRGVPIDLTRSEFKVVSLLAALPDTDISYREIYDAVKGRRFLVGSGPEGYRANVRTFIKRIRRKFAAIDPRFSSIQVYPSFGYRWRTMNDAGSTARTEQSVPSGVLDGVSHPVNPPLSMRAIPSGVRG